MKKIFNFLFAGLLCFALCFTLVGCGGDNNSTDGEVNEETTQSDSSAEDSKVKDTNKELIILLASKFQEDYDYLIGLSSNNQDSNNFNSTILDEPIIGSYIDSVTTNPYGISDEYYNNKIESFMIENANIMFKTSSSVLKQFASEIDKNGYDENKVYKIAIDNENYDFYIKISTGKVNVFAKREINTTQNGTTQQGLGYIEIEFELNSNSSDYSACTLYIWNDLEWSNGNSLVGSYSNADCYKLFKGVKLLHCTHLVCGIDNEYPWGVEDYSIEKYASGEQNIVLVKNVESHDSEDEMSALLDQKMGISSKLAHARGVKAAFDSYVNSK